MNPRRTHTSNAIFALVGGNEDNDLWVEETQMAPDGEHVIVSVWEPSKAERMDIANGASIELVVWGDAQPPVAIGVVDVPLGKAPLV